MLGQLGSSHQRRRIAGDVPCPGHPLEPGPHRGQRPGHRRLGQSPVVKFAQVAAYLQMIDGMHFDALPALLDQVGGKIVDFALVRAQGMRGRSPLMRQHGQELLRQLRGLRLHFAPLLVARG